jgi:ATP-dependent Lon protease
MASIDEKIINSIIIKQEIKHENNNVVMNKKSDEKKNTNTKNKKKNDKGENKSKKKKEKSSLTNSSVSESSKSKKLNVLKIFNLEELENLIDSNDDYDDSEESYINKIGDEKAAELYDIQEKLYEMEKHDVPIRFQILESKMPDASKARVLNQYEMIMEMNASSEAYKILRWIEGVLKVPFGNIYSNEEKDKKIILQNAKKMLDDAVYGHNECKEYFLQMIAQFLCKNDTTGRAFGIQGPPGNGKTSLVKEGICKALGRPFSMIALGGLSDGTLLEGHDFTYEGSKWGRLVQCLMDAKCMNPIIYFDELDKVSETQQGQEIIGILTHLIDYSQNERIQDRYFNGIDLDFSKCIFVFSFNDETKINPILKDRIHIIKTKGFSNQEKVTISQDYLLDQICKNFPMTKNDIIFSDEIINYILTKYTSDEEGVREIKRKLECIVLKINYCLLLELPGYNLPFQVTKDFVDLVLNTETSQINKNYLVNSTLYI